MVITSVSRVLGCFIVQCNQKKTNEQKKGEELPSQFSRFSYRLQLLELVLPPFHLSVKLEVGGVLLLDDLLGVLEDASWVVAQPVAHRLLRHPKLGGAFFLCAVVLLDEITHLVGVVRSTFVLVWLGSLSPAMS